MLVLAILPLVMCRQPSADMRDIARLVRDTQPEQSGEAEASWALKHAAEEQLAKESAQGQRYEDMVAKATEIVHDRLVRWFRTGGCNRNYEEMCPKGWSTRGFLCVPGEAYTGPCGSASFNSDSEKADFAMRCNAEWPCSSQTSFLSQPSTSSVWMRSIPTPQNAITDRKTQAPLIYFEKRGQAFVESRSTFDPDSIKHGLYLSEPLYPAVASVNVMEARGGASMAETGQYEEEGTRLMRAFNSGLAALEQV